MTTEEPLRVDSGSRKTCRRTFKFLDTSTASSGRSAFQATEGHSNNNKLFKNHGTSRPHRSQRFLLFNFKIGGNGANFMKRKMVKNFLCFISDFSLHGSSHEWCLRNKLK
jgi:hypothetical protein